MNRYSAERKESVIQKMMPPHNIPIPRLAEETGISDVPLYNWRKQARAEGIAVPADGKNSEKWSSEDKFAIVLEAISLNEAELAEYCRQKGLYAEHKHSGLKFTTPEQCHTGEATTILEHRQQV